MSTAIHALDYLAKPEASPAPGVCVLFGDDAFLKRLALAALRSEVLDGDDAEFSLSVLDGTTAEPRDMLDELSTRAMFGGGRRMVVVEEADEFVSRHRAMLEDYVARPKPGGVLVLNVKSWPSNTRLAKAVVGSGLTLECAAPPPARLLKWLSAWTLKRHQAQLDRESAEALLEIVEPDLGLLDQELAKLAASAGPGGVITPEMVRDLVGGWRTKTTWEMLDEAVAGRAAVALVQLDRLLQGGENPIALLGQVGSTLRRFAAAARLIAQDEAAGRRGSLRGALEAAGFKSFIAGKAEGQLKQLGRQRAGKLYRWLLEADLALKGVSSSPARARLVLEELIARLSTVADPRNAAASAAGSR
jgi:DNA polymerase-3 subunit delta